MPGANLLLTLMRMFFDFFATRVWVARTCSTSEVPIPMARAASAPLVVVWESPHHDCHPGQAYTLLRADDMYYALTLIREFNIGNAPLPDVSLQGIQLLF